MGKIRLKIFSSLILLLGGCFIFTNSIEALRLKTSWGERVDLSVKIIRGRVVKLKSVWNPERTLLYTRVKILVGEYLKGKGPNEITLKIPGGKVGEITHSVSDTPQFSQGNEYVIFFDSSGQVTGGPDGVYLLKGEDGEGFLKWLRAYLSGDPEASKEGPTEKPRLHSK